MKEKDNISLSRPTPPNLREHRWDELYLECAQSFEHEKKSCSNTSEILQSRALLIQINECIIEVKSCHMHIYRGYIPTKYAKRGGKSKSCLG